MFLDFLVFPRDISPDIPRGGQGIGQFGRKCTGYEGGGIIVTTVIRGMAHDN